MTSKGRYKIGTIARSTGVSPVLLRAWERRYGLLRPDRGSGGHRLYTEDDLILLGRVQDLIKEGRSIGEIAAMGREAILDSASGTAPSAEGPSSSSPGGERLSRYKDQIVDAVVRLDSDDLNRTLDILASSVSIPTLIEDVIEPVAREVGDLWKAGQCSVASEHMVSLAFLHRLRKLIESAETLPTERARLLIAACFPDEDHQLGLVILSYFLNRAGFRVLYLGARLPFEELVPICRKSLPAAVMLSVSRKATFRKHRTECLKFLEQIDSSCPVYVGGAGAPERDSDLEARGLRLTPQPESAREAARRLGRDLRAQK